MLDMALQLCGHEFHQHGIVLVDSIAESVQIRRGVGVLVKAVVGGVDAVEIYGGFFLDIPVYKGRFCFMEGLTQQIQSGICVPHIQEALKAAGLQSICAALQIGGAFLRVAAAFGKDEDKTVPLHVFHDVTGFFPR